MPNDAKLGLIVGVGLVVTVAVAFFRKDPMTTAPTLPGEKAAARVHAVEAPAPPRGPQRPVPARKTSRGPQSEGRHHTVEEGETLYSLALRYYGDGEKFVDIYRANREVLKTPDRLTPGTVLVIPDLEEPADLAGGNAEASKETR